MSAPPPNPRSEVAQAIRHVSKQNAGWEAVAADAVLGVLRTRIEALRQARAYDGGAYELGADDALTDVLALLGDAP